MTAFERLCDRLGAAPGSAAAEIVSAMVNEMIFSDDTYTDEEIIKAVAKRYEDAVKQAFGATPKRATYKVRRQGYRVAFLTRAGEIKWSRLFPRCDFRILEDACKRLKTFGEIKAYAIEWVDVVVDVD